MVKKYETKNTCFFLLINLLQEFFFGIFFVKRSDLIKQRIKEKIGAKPGSQSFHYFSWVCVWGGGGGHYFCGVEGEGKGEGWGREGE